MRWQRFMNWCREGIGLPRKPIHYVLHAYKFSFGCSPKPEWSLFYFRWLWRSLKG
jgi:hypothetical protein